VEAIFWFHPLVWWIGTRLVDERERACDEAVLHNGSEPEVYAQGILNVCKLYVESPLACVSGVTGANLKKRIEAIMADTAAVSLSRAKKAALALAGTAALAIPVVIGILNAPAIRAQSGPRPKFEVASVKLCQPGEAPSGGGRKGGGGAGPDPGLLSIACQPVERLIQTAYLRFADGKAQAIGTPGRVSQRQVNQPIEGGPAWVRSDRYRIDAKPESPQIQEMMRGPMMQTLLEERFKLKIRREPRDVPVYALVVGKGGPKLQPSHGCVPLDFTNGPPPPPGPGEHTCGPFGPDANGGIVTYGQTLAGLCAQFSVALDRDVVDRTGIAGLFDMHLDLTDAELFPFDARGATATDGAASAPPDSLTAFMAAVQKLGLKIEPAKAAADFLVIEHIERPSEN
jgi:bla regulator protein blaR1